MYLWTVNFGNPLTFVSRIVYEGRVLTDQDVQGSGGVVVEELNHPFSISAPA